MRYLGLYVLNSFVQLYKIKEGTPEYEDYVKFALIRYKNVIRKQLYLQSHGVSFDYTDKQNYVQIEGLISACKEQDEEINSLTNN